MPAMSRPSLMPPPPICTHHIWQGLERRLTMTLSIRLSRTAGKRKRPSPSLTPSKLRRSARLNPHLADSETKENESHNMDDPPHFGFAAAGKRAHKMETPASSSDQPVKKRRMSSRVFQHPDQPHPSLHPQQQPAPAPSQNEWNDIEMEDCEDKPAPAPAPPAFNVFGSVPK